MPTEKNKYDKYDVVIVGAGISGLVCGCYLAKANVRVLIVEHHDKPGGYCTSFSRKGYTFDAAVHYLGSCRENEGIIYSILKDHSLLDKINLLRNDPCEKIIMPNETIYIRKDNENTREELKQKFPEEKGNIDRFFNFILSGELLSVIAKTRYISFEKLLNEFFIDPKLKIILSVPIGNLGIAPSKASALASVFLYREYILDGGYYPEGGIQSFPDLLACRFREYGGELLLSHDVSGIIVENRKVMGVKLREGDVIRSNIVVSNADAVNTFEKMTSCGCEESEKIRKLEMSPSAFIVYLGLNTDLEKVMERHFSTWLFSTYDVERCYDTENNYNLGKIDGRGKVFDLDYIICHFPSLIDKKLAPENRSIVRAMLWVKDENGATKYNYEEKIYKKIITKLEKIIPDIEKFIEVKEIAVPRTLNRYTLNSNGSALGLASTVAQVDKNYFPSQTSISGLYLTGHWVTNGIGQSGIPLVAYCGRNLAATLIRNVSN